MKETDKAVGHWSPNFSLNTAKVKFVNAHKVLFTLACFCQILDILKFRDDSCAAVEDTEMSVIPTEINPEQIQTFKDFLVSYNKLSEMCFIDCVNDFTTRSIKPVEEKCAVNCTEKFLKMNQRISQRFQEYQIIANENALAATQKVAGK